MEINKKINLECKFDLIASNSTNPDFIEGKVWVMAHGKNRNYSDIRKYTVERKLYTIKNIPVVGFFKDGDFTTHSHKAIPYGVVPGNGENVFAWESVDVNGVATEYLTARAFIWKDYLPSELFSSDGNLISNFDYNQSMEITVKDYSENEDGTVLIKDFNFSALCLLSKEVEPAFEEARIEMYSLNEFVEKFNSMMSKLNIDNDVKEEDILPIKKNEPKTEFTLTNSQLVEELAKRLGKQMFRDRWGDERARYWYIDHKDGEVFARDRKDDFVIYGFTFTMNGDRVTIDFNSGSKKKIEYIDREEDESDDDDSIHRFSISKQIDAVVRHVLSTKKERFEKLELENTTQASELLEASENYAKLLIENQALVNAKEDIEIKYNALNAEVGDLQDLRKCDLLNKFEKLIGDTSEFVEIKSNSAMHTYAEIEANLSLVFANKALGMGNFELSSKKPDGTLKVTAMQDKNGFENTGMYGGALDKYKAAQSI